jgi:peroxiredoxin
MNHKLIAVVLICLGAWSGRAENTITVTAEVPCAGMTTLNLYTFGGLHFEHAYQATVKEGVAQFTLPEHEWQFYYLGANESDVLPVILGKEKTVLIKVQCDRISSSQVVGSAIAVDYQNLKSMMNGLKNQANQLTQQHYKQLVANEVPPTFAEEMAKIDQRKLNMLEEYTRSNPFFAQILSLNTYLSYFVQPNEHENEMAFFAKEYFSFVKFDAPSLGYQPWVFEAFKAYGGALAGTKMPTENLIGFIQPALEKVPTGSRTRMLAISGLLSGLEKDNPGGFVHFARQYIKEYGQQFPEQAKRLADKIQTTGRLEAGGEAPDFSQNDPDGKPITLHGLRGKVLLVDFWASWCGPCRRENPHVRKLYDQYHEKGFDILGVSLDSDRQRWLDAIAKDGLIWHHVSDLKGWKNEAGQLYQVSSIPHTVLIDPQGKIIARNLRGPALEQKLAELLGE